MVQLRHKNQKIHEELGHTTCADGGTVMENSYLSPLCHICSHSCIIFVSEFVNNLGGNKVFSHNRILSKFYHCLFNVSYQVSFLNLLNCLSLCLWIVVYEAFASMQTPD